MKSGNTGAAHTLITLLLFSLMALALVLALVPFQRWVKTEMENLQNLAITRLETLLGRPVGYDSIAPSFLRYIEIRGLVIQGNSSNPAPLLSISKIRVFYRWGALIRREGRDILKEIRIENSSFSFDSVRDKDLLDFLTSLNTGSPSFPRLVLSGRNLSLKVTSPAGSLAVEKLFFELKPQGERLNFQARFSGSADEIPSVPNFSGLTGTIRVSGRLLRDFSSSDVQVLCTNISSPIVDLPRITLHVQHQGSTIKLQKIQDKSPFDVSVSYQGETETIQLVFASEEFIPAGYFTLKGPLSQYAPWLSSRISGRAEVNYAVETGDMDYTTVMNLFLNNSLLPTPFSANLDLSGNLTSLTLRTLRVQSDYGLWGFRGTVTPGDPYPVPQGTLWFSDVPLGDSMLHSVFRIEREDPFISLKSSDIRLGDLTLEKTAIQLFPYGDNLEFLVTTYLTEEDAKPLFSGEGNLQIRPDFFLEASAGMDDLPLGKIASLFTDQVQIEEWIDPLEVSTYLFMSTDLQRFAFTTSGVDIIDREQQDNRISLSLSGNNSGITLQNIDASWEGSRLTGDASFMSGESGSLAASMNILFEDTPYILQGALQEAGNFTLTGNYGISGDIRPSGKRFLFDFSCEQVPIPLKDTVTRVSLKTGGFFESSASWEIDLHEGIIASLPLPDQENQLLFSGLINNKQIFLPNLSFRDRFSTLTGSASMDLPSLRSSGNLWIELADLSGNERYNLRMNLQEELSISGEIARVPLKRFTSDRVGGFAEGFVLVSGSRDNPEITLQGGITSGELDGDPFSLSLLLKYEGSLLTFSTPDLRFMNNRVNNLYFQYDLLKGEFQAGGSLRGAIKTDILQGDFNAAGNTLSGSTLRELPEILQQPISGTLRLENMQKGETIIEPLNLAFQRSDGNVMIHGGPEDSLEAVIRKDKSFALVMKHPLPLRARAEGTLEKSNITAEINDIDLDVQVLETVLRIPQFRFLDGRAEGHLSVAGSFNDPVINGTLQAYDVVAENPYVKENLGPFDTLLQFDDKTLSILNTVVPVGEAQAVADLTFILDHWMSESLEIDIQTLSQKGLHVVQAFGRMNTDGYIRGHLNVKSDPTIVNLTGDLEALSTTVTIRNPEEKTQEKVDDQHFLKADVHLTTGKGVEFLWPSKNLPVLRTFAETGEHIRVIYDDTKDQFSIQGEVSIKGGQIYYVQRNFYIRQGAIIFNENQNKFDPLLSATAELREVNSEGESVKVYLIVEENPLSTFQPRFESDPPMSTADIFSLIGGQMFYASGAESFDFTQALALTGEFVGQFGLLRSFEDRVKSIFNLDLFTLRTPIVSNLILDKLIPQPVEEEYNEPDNLSRYLDNTSLFLGKYFGNDVFLQAILRLDFYDQLSGGPDISKDVLLDTEITLEWKTPITLIEFSLFPDLTDMEGNFLNPSLGLSWSYSY